MCFFLGLVTRQGCRGPGHLVHTAHEHAPARTLRVRPPSLRLARLTAAPQAAPSGSADSVAGGARGLGVAMFHALPAATHQRATRKLPPRSARAVIGHGPATRRVRTGPGSGPGAAAALAAAPCCPHTSRLTSAVLLSYCPAVPRPSTASSAVRAAAGPYRRARVKISFSKCSRNRISSILRLSNGLEYFCFTAN